MRYSIQNTGNQDAYRNGWVWSQNRGKGEGMQREIKKNIQGTNSDGKETRTQINDFEQKEEISIQPEQNEATRIQKNEEKLRNLQDNFKYYKTWIIVVPEGEEEEIENFSEKIMKEKFPNLAKEIDFRDVQEAQRVPKKLDPRRNTPRPVSYTHLTLPTRGSKCRSRWSPYH